MKRTSIAGLWLVLLLAPLDVRAQDSLLAPRSKGSVKAPVTVYEMSDFQCPFCLRFTTTTFPALEKEYIVTGKVRWVFINMPMTSLHPNAPAAAEFASCAAKQGRFWPTHDRLFAEQSKWAPLTDPRPFFMGLVARIGLNRDRLKACLESGQGRAMVRDDADGAARTGATGTPTFYIEGGIMTGAQPIEVFRKVLDSVYQAKRAKKP